MDALGSAQADGGLAFRVTFAGDRVWRPAGKWSFKSSFHIPFSPLIRKTEPIGKTVESLRKARARFDEVALNVALMEGVNDAQADVEALARVGDPDWVIVIGALMTDRGAKVHPKAGEIEARLNELGRKTRRLEAVARAICEQGAFARLASNVR